MFKYKKHIKDDIYKIVSNVLDINIALVYEIHGEEDLSTYGMTSISAMRLLIELEEKYNFEFEDRDLLIEKFNTLSKLFTLLKKYLDYPE